MKAFIVITLILTGLFLTREVYGFEDDFLGTSLDTNLWDVNTNNGTYSVADGYLTINQNQSITYPYIVSKPIEEESNYVYEIRLKMSGSYNYGFGLGISEDLIPNGTVNNLSWSDFIFLVWAKGSSTYGLHTWLCPITILTCNSGSYNSSLDSVLFDNWSTYKIIKNNDYYEIYKDNTLISKLENLSTSPRHIWIGNPQKTGVVSRGKIMVDYVRYTKYAPTPPTTFILIPGFGASWNYSALFSNTQSTDWHIPSWVNTYQNLIDSLQNAGYQENQNLFVFAYDWRKPLSNLATDLEAYIDNLKSQNKITNNTDIKIIGHSFGGLVARSYYQKYMPSEVKQIVTVGSPHQGITQAYEAWAGGKITHGDWWAKGIFSLVLKINKQLGETDRQTLQRLAPSMSNLLPTFDFLEDKNQVVKPVTSQLLQNTYLNNLDSTIGTGSALFTTLTGNQNNTPQKYTYVSPNWYDRLFGDWVDGKPINTTLTTLGDSTVLNTSAKGIFTNTSTTNLDHGDIVFDGQGIFAIFDSLDLDTSKVVATRSGGFFQNVLAISLRSPGKIQVTDSNNNTYGFNGNSTSDYLYLPNEKILMIKDPVGDYKVNIISDGEVGPYNLYTSISQADQTQTDKLEGYISSGDTDAYQINPDNLITTKPNTTPDYLELLNENSDLLNQTCSTQTGAYQKRCQKLSSYLSSAIQNTENLDTNTLFYRLHQTFSQSQLDFPQDSSTYLKIKEISQILESYLQNPIVTGQPNPQSYDLLHSTNTQTILGLETQFETTQTSSSSANILKAAINNTSPSSSQSANLSSDFFKLLIQRNYLESLY